MEKIFFNSKIFLKSRKIQEIKINFFQLKKNSENWKKNLKLKKNIFEI